MAFIEVEFPRNLALMATGGPGFSTSVNSAFSGFEQRNQNWSQARAKFNVAFENKPVSEWEAFEAMFYAARGQANAWRLFDPGDYSGTGQFIAEADGVQTQFQLQKTYTFPISNYSVVRPVQKPITSLIQNYQGAYLTDTVEVYVDGVKQSHLPGYTLGGAYSLDATTGVVTFAVAPADEAVITADYEYHIPVRFDFDQIQKQYITPINAPNKLLVTISGINLIEVRIVPGQSS